ncbi:MAG: transposase, partial [Bryobacteraceae bacterium]
MDRILDNARTGPLYLRRPEIANLVVESILYHQQGLNHYELHAYVVMANHVHLLITPRIAVSKAMHSLKRFTARKANELLKLTGRPFWQDESYDHLVRNQIEFGRSLIIIEMNPAKAGLVATPKRSSGPAPGPIANRPAG